LPHIFDPQKGWFASANQDNLPHGYPHTISFQWTDPFRFSRVEEVLGAPKRFMLTDLMRLQQDELSLPARALVPLLKGAAASSARAKSALDLLTSWNFVLAGDSVPAGIYVAWEKALAAAMWELRVPKEARKIFTRQSLSTEKLIQWLTVPDGQFGANPVAGRDALLAKTFEQAVADLERRFGPDMRGWRYGQERYKHVQLTHPLSAAVRADLRGQLDIGPLPRGGSSHTVNNTSDRDNQASGASFRIIADTGDWDRSVGTNTPGQSGDPASAHYRDLFGPWAQGQYFPAFYSRPKIESVTEARIELVPSS
jgi:penicillin amidase